MDSPIFYNAPFVNTVLHPTDFSEPSEEAFAHALAISLVRKTKLTLLHVQKQKGEWQNFPAVRNTLERWKMLEKGSAQADVFQKLSVHVEKIGIRSKNVFGAVHRYLKNYPTDLIVLATQGREGPERLIRPSMAERISKTSISMTLFVPHRGKGFVSRESGQIKIQKIFIPIDYKPRPLAAVEYATRVARIMGTPMEIMLFHVSGEREMPAINLPDLPHTQWKKETAKGKIVPEILNAASNFEPDIIIMATLGNDGFLDALRGSVTDRILRKSKCPLLAVPSPEN